MASPTRSTSRSSRRSPPSGPASGVGVSVHALSCFGLVTKGTEEQKQKWLPDMLGGELLGAYCLSEPHAGSDPSAMKTRARRDGDEYVINGAKAWTTHGGHADFYKVMARTSDDRNGISCFLVPADTEGLSADPPERKMGLTGSATATMRFDDVRIPAERLLGEEGDGLKIALAGLDSGRLGHRLGGDRAGPGGAGPRDGVRQGAQAVRPADHRLPGPRVPARRHGGRRADRAGDDPARRPAQGPRPAVLPRGLDREADRDRHGDEGDHRCRAGAGWLRLHPRLPGRAVHARGQGHPDLRGHQPDPADGDQPLAGQGRLGPDADRPPA